MAITNLIIVFLIIVIAVFKSLRKRCVTERVQFLPDWVLDKMNVVLCTSFIFLIQETSTIIFFSLRYGPQSVVRFFIAIIYFLVVCLFSVNQLMYPLAFFRNNKAQLDVIIGKALCPLFLALPTTAHFVLLLLLLLTWIIDITLTHKNRNSRLFNRLLTYKVFGIILVFMMLAYYSV